MEPEPYKHSSVRGNVACVDLFYPRNEGSIDTIEVCLMDVRAADDIRIKYDFDRDGWVIYQMVFDEWDKNDEEWVEVWFVDAWALDRREGGE